MRCPKCKTGRLYMTHDISDTRVWQCENCNADHYVVSNGEVGAWWAALPAHLKERILPYPNNNHPFGVLSDNQQMHIMQAWYDAHWA